MGYLLDYYLKKIQEEKEVKKKVEPNPGKDTAGYVAYQKEMRKVSRELLFMRSKYKEIGISLQDVFEINKSIMGEEKANQARNDLEKGYSFENRLTDEVKKIYPDYKEKFAAQLKDLDGAEKNKFYVSLLPKEVADNCLARLMMQRWSGPDEQKYIEALDKQLSADQQNTLKQAFENYKDISELSLNETVTHPYREKIDSLKQSMPEEIKNNPELKEKYEHVLEYAAENLTSTTEEIRNEFENYERDIQRTGDKVPEVLVEENKATFENGKYLNLYKPVEYDGSELFTVAEGKEEIAKGLLKEPMKISDHTKNAIKQVFQKFDEMGILTKENASPELGEQGTKIYSHRVVAEKRQALTEALNAPNPDPRKIIKAGEEYEKSKEDLKQLYKIVKENFPNDDSFFPGNVDNTRTKILDWDMTSDVKTSAQLNSLFLLYNECLVNGYSLDEFLANPGEKLYGETHKKIGECGLEGQAKGKSFDEVLDIFLSVKKEQPGAKQEFTARDYFTNQTVHMGTARSLTILFYMESDPEIRKANVLYSNTLQDYMTKVGDYESAKFAHLTRGEVTRTGEKLLLPAQMRRQFMTNLIIVSDADRNVSDLLGIPNTDNNGIEKPRFSLDDYIKNHSADYTGMMFRTERLLTRCKAEAAVRAGAPGELEIKASALSAYTRILQAHPEDAAKTEYQTMLKQAEEFAKEIGLNPEATEPQKDALSFFDRSNPSSFTARLAENVREADRGVHMGSGEYDKAMKSVVNLDQMMKEMLADKSIEGRREKIEQIREHLDTIDANVDAYMVRSDKKKSLDEKAQKRKDTLLNVKDSLKTVRYILDDKGIELDALEAAKGTAQMNAETTIISGLKTIYKLAKESGIGAPKVTASGALTAAEKLNKLADKTTKDGSFTPEDTKLAKQCVAALILHDLVSTDEKIQKNFMDDGKQMGIKDGNYMPVYKKRINQIMGSKEFNDLFPEKIGPADVHEVLVDMATDKKTTENFMRNVHKTAEEKKNKEATKNKETGKKTEGKTEGKTEEKTEMPKAFKPK